MHRIESGLTLLEVLAAAMIFAMVMTVLIGTSSTAVHHVGMSARRLEASLVADGILADLEIQMKRGIAPEIDEEESELEHFAIRVLRTDLMEGAEATPLDAGANATGAGTDIAAMLGSDLPEVAKHLKRYDIEVEWIEQDGPQVVTRTTFAFDWQAAAIEYSELFARNDENQAGGINGGSDSGGTAAGSDEGGLEDIKAAIRAKAKGSNSRRNGHNARLNALSGAGRAESAIDLYQRRVRESGQGNVP
jgi:hypothetical protein